MKSFRFLILFLIMSLNLFLIGVGIAQITKVYLSNVNVPSVRTLTIVFTGGGTGQVSVTPPDSTITSTFSFDYPLNTIVTISGTATGNSTFVGWEGAGCSGTSPCNIVMSENKTVYADFWLPPLGDYLIGWYRFNEGSGSTVYNVATNGSLGGGLLPNLNVVFNKNNFWTYLPGFGSVPEAPVGAGDGLVDFAWGYQHRTIGGPNGYCVGAFVRAKPSTYPPSGFGGTYVSVLENNNESIPGKVYSVHHNSFYAPSDRTGVVYKGIGYELILGQAEILGRWHFHFINNYGNHYLVRPEGDRIYLGYFNLIETNPRIMRYLFAGVWRSNTELNKGYYPAGGSFGDWLIYNNTMLTETQWRQIYDNLRSRYGMAPRSGW